MQDKIEIKNIHAFILLVLLLALFIVLIDGFINKNKILKKERDEAVLRADSVLSEKLLFNQQIDNANLKLNQCLKEKEEITALNVLLYDDIKLKTIQLETPDRNNFSVTVLRNQLKEARNQKENCESRMIALNEEIKNLEDTLNQLDRQLTELKVKMNY